MLKEFLLTMAWNSAIATVVARRGTCRNGRADHNRIATTQQRRANDVWWRTSTSTWKRDRTRVRCRVAVTIQQRRHAACRQDLECRICRERTLTCRRVVAWATRRSIQRRIENRDVKAVWRITRIPDVVCPGNRLAG